RAPGASLSGHQPVTKQSAALFLSRERRKIVKPEKRDSVFPALCIGLFPGRRGGGSGAGVKNALGLADATGPPRHVSGDRDREIAGEVQIALDPHVKAQADRLHFAKAPASKLWKPQIGKAEKGVTVAIQFGRKPDAATQRIEEFYHGDGVDIALAAIGEELLALGAGQEDHAAALRSVDAVSSRGRCASSQSAAFLAWEAARTMARLSSHSSSSQEPM